MTHRTPRRSSQSVALRSLSGLLLVLTICTCTPTSAPAQYGEPTLNLMAISWVRGRYGEPLLCTVDGRSADVMRPVLVTPGPRTAAPPVARVRIFSLESLQATRCASELVQDEKFDLEGILYVYLDREAPIDLLEKKFRDMLTRDNGFTYKIQSGQLQLRRSAGEDGEKPPPETVEFKGGTAKFRLLDPHEDATRILKDFANRRKMELEISTRDGEKLRFHIIHLQAR